MADIPIEISVLNTSGEIGRLKKTHRKAANILAYLMHQEFVQEEQKSTFLKIVRDENLPMVNMSKEFALHLINNLGVEKRKLLARMQEQDQNDYGFANEGLVDFVEMELWDPTVTYRKWEYGRYAINHFIKSFDSHELPTESKTTDGDHTMLLERFASGLNQSQENWDDQVRLFLIQADEVSSKSGSNNHGSLWACW